MFITDQFLFYVGWDSKLWLIFFRICSTTSYFVAHSYKVSLEETLLSTLCTEPWLGRSVKIEKSFSQNASLQITKSFPTQGFPGLLERLRW